MPAWLTKLLATFGSRYLKEVFFKLIDQLTAWMRDKERARQQAEAKKELDKVNQDPQSTPDDRAKAYENYINGGKS